MAEANDAEVPSEAEGIEILKKAGQTGKAKEAYLEKYGKGDGK